MTVPRFVAHSPTSRPNGTYLYLLTPRQILCDGTVSGCSRSRVRVLEQHGCDRNPFLDTLGMFTLDLEDKLSGVGKVGIAQGIQRCWRWLRKALRDG